MRAPARVGHDNPVLNHRVHDVGHARLEVEKAIRASVAGNHVDHVAVVEASIPGKRMLAYDLDDAERDRLVPAGTALDLHRRAAKRGMFD